MDNRNAVFARLFASPQGNLNALAVIRYSRNKARFRPAGKPGRLQPRTTAAGSGFVQSGSNQGFIFNTTQDQVIDDDDAYDIRHARLSQVSEEDDTIAGLSDMIPDLNSECLELKFEDHRNFQQGILIGRSYGSCKPGKRGRDQFDGCDIQVPWAEKSVGQRQVLITFDEENRLILQDVQDPGSTTALTSVSYGSNGNRDLESSFRRGFTWILSGASFTKGEFAKVSLSPTLSFFIVVEPFILSSAKHRMNVRHFHDFFDELVSKHGRKYRDGLRVTAPSSLASTEAPSGISTPAPAFTGPLYVVQDKRLGRGGQAIVEKRWDVSTDKVFAAKKYESEDLTHRYETEVQILKAVEHPHIVQILFTEDSQRRMYLELAPLGTLQDTVHVTPLETLSVLQQVLDALTYLHSLQPAIVHRDLKPSNLLVFSRQSGINTHPIFVKLCDFGFSKADKGELTTKVWSEGWAAPEVRTHGTHSEKMDLWSLGMISLKYSHGWPPFPLAENGESRHYSSRFWQTWMQSVLSTVHQANEPCAFIKFLGNNLLQERPADRLSGQKAKEAARNLGVCLCAQGFQPARMPDTLPVEEGNTLDQSDITSSASGQGADVMETQASGPPRMNGNGFTAQDMFRSRDLPSSDPSNPGNYGLHSSRPSQDSIVLQGQIGRHDLPRSAHASIIGTPRRVSNSDDNMVIDSVDEQVNGG